MSQPTNTHAFVQKAILPKRPLMSMADESSDFWGYLKHGNRLTQKGLGREGSGELMPHEFIRRIETHLQHLSPMRQVCRTHNVHADHLELIVDHDRAEVGWMQGEKSVDETALPEWKQQSISLHTLFAKPCISQQLLDDAAFDLEDWLSQRIAEQMARLENKAFTVGDGQHQPAGFLKAPIAEPGKPLCDAIEQWTTDIADLPDSLLDVMHALPSEYVNGALWMMSRATLARIKRLKNASTGHYVWQPSLAQGTPVVLNDDMDGRLAFGNFAHAYQIVDRSDVHVLRDPYSSKPFVEFFATKRVGGALIQGNAMKLLNIAGEEA